MNRMTFALACTGLLLTTTGSPAAPAGSWPCFGHDFQRTGHADGTGQLKSAPIAWTLSLGGLLSPQDVLVSDVDQDGRPETVSISGGRVVAVHPNGMTLWSSPLISPSQLLGAWDLNGNGSMEVVVNTTTGVQVLAGASGQTVGTLSASPPLAATFVPQGAGGILILSTYQGPVTAYDFRSGAFPTTSLWTVTGDDQMAGLAGDLDGDGAPDFVRVLYAGFEIDDPLTGATKYSLPTMSPTAYYYYYTLANVDGNPGLEIIAVDTSYVYSADTGIYVAGVRTGALTTLWSSTATPAAALGANYLTVLGSAVDLDGDGSVELVYSKWDGMAQAWTTTVADAATGTSVGSIAGQVLQAVADIDGDGKSEIVVRSSSQPDQSPGHSSVTAYDFDSRQTGPVAKSWSLALSHVFTTMTTAAPYGPGLALPVVADFDPAVPGLEILVGADPNNTGVDATVETVHGGDGSIASKYTVPATVTASIPAWSDHLTSATSANDVEISQDDGTIHVLDQRLIDHDHFTAGSYANWLSGIANPTGQPNLFAATSNNHLLWIDGRQLHADGTPYVRFDEPGVAPAFANASQSFPMDPVVLLGGHSTTLVTVEQQATAQSIVAHGTSGVEVWRTPLSTGVQVVSPGVYALDLTGDGNDDVLISLTDTNTSQESLAVYDGVSGALVRSTPIGSIVSGADELLTGSLVDVNGDGKLDLVTPLHSAASILAIDLQPQPFGQIWLTPQGSGMPAAYNGTITFAPIGSGKTPSLLRSNGNNGFGPYEVLSSSGQILAFGDQGLPAQHGFDLNAAVTVGSATSGSFDIAAAGTSGVALSRVRRIAGDTMTVMWTVYAAAGKVSATAPTQGYALHDPLVFDENGDGTDDVLFGSDDGYVYALSSADGSLLFAANLGSPVAHLIASNIDLDKPLELVASLVDGRLVALDDQYQAGKDQPDGGVDAGDAGTDAGRATDAAAEGGGADGSSDASNEGGPGGNNGGGGGCGCVAVDSGGTGSAGLVLGTGGLAALFVRRRRRQRT